jgi:hypothetical protein
MRRASSLALVGALPLAAFAAGCGGNQTTASKSAAAFDEAQRKGVTPTAGEAHGHDGEAEGTKRGPAAGSGEMPPAHSGHDSGTSSARSGRSRAGMDHSNMPGMATAHGAHQGSIAAGTPGHARAPQANAPTTRMDHASMPGMDHSAMVQPSAGTAPPIPERPAAVASPEQLVDTLRPNALDVPEPTAVREAARAAEIAQQMAGGHGMSHGTYRQIDAGRDDVAPTPSGHEGHQMTPAAPTATSADPHAGHARPAAPRPSPTPSPRPTPTPRPKKENR